MGSTEHQPAQRHQRALSDAFCWSRFPLLSLQPERAKPKQVPRVSAAAPRLSPALPARISSPIPRSVPSQHIQGSSASIGGLAAPSQPSSAGLPLLQQELSHRPGCSFHCTPACENSVLDTGPTAWVFILPSFTAEEFIIHKALACP